MSPGLVTHPASVMKPCPAPAAFLATEDPENSPLVRLPRIPPDHPSLGGPVLCWDEPWGGQSSHTAACPPHAMGAAGRASGGHNEEVAGRVRRVPPRSGSAHGAGSGATATGRGTGGPHTPVTVPGAFSACHCSGPADRPACPGAGGRRRGDSRGGFQLPSPHRPVLLEIVGDGPVPGRLVTLQPSSRAMTQTPRAARSGRGRTGRGPAGRGWSALPAQTPVRGQPCPGRSPAPRPRNLGLISSPASWVFRSSC